MGVGVRVGVGMGGFGVGVAFELLIETENLVDILQKRMCLNILTLGKVMLICFANFNKHD
jgi:hypothetical protein